MNYFIGFVLAFCIGAGCRYLEIPSPAPQALAGSLLVLTVTVGYLLMDKLLG